MTDPLKEALCRICRTHYGRDCICDQCARTELRRSDETIKRLNRRCQLAESAAKDNVDACKREGISFGRVLANHAAVTAEEELRRLEAELHSADNIARIIDEMVDGGGLDIRSVLADARLCYGHPFEYKHNKRLAAPDAAKQGREA